MQNCGPHDMAGIMQRTRKCRHPILIAHQQGRRWHSLNLALNPSTSLSTQGMWKETGVVFPVFQGKDVGDEKILRVTFFHEEGGGTEMTNVHFFVIKHLTFKPN